MKNAKRYLIGFAAAASLFLIGSVMRSPGSQAKGAYATPVQVMNTTANSVPASPAIPGSPFVQEVSSSVSLAAIGPGAANAFAISSLTVTNFNNNQQVVRVFQPSLTGTLINCSTATVNGGGQSVRVNLAPGQSMHLAFPSPLVMTPSNGLACAGVSFTDTTGSVYVTAVGYAQ